jgi:hypothetical protein
MEQSFEDRRATERRNQYGALMLAAFARSRTPLSFQDLVSVVGPLGAKFSDVADWLATARQSGLLQDEGFEKSDQGMPAGPRLFSLTPEALAVIRVDRRRVDRRRNRPSA